MSSLVGDEKFMIRATEVKVTDDTLRVELEDGRTISVPLAWYPRLMHATRKERNNYEIDDYGIEWPDVDELISIRGLLLGNKSGESPRSLQRWLGYRERGEKVPVPTMPLPRWFAKTRKSVKRTGTRSRTSKKQST
jgi:hypothetical protein